MQHCTLFMYYDYYIMHYDHYIMHCDHDVAVQSSVLHCALRLGYFATVQSSIA